MGKPNGLFVHDQHGRVHRLRLQRPALPALIKVNRVAPAAFTRTADQFVAFPGGDDTLIVDGSNDALNGTLDSVPVALDTVTNQVIELNAGTFTRRRPSQRRPRSTSRSRRSSFRS